MRNENCGIVGFDDESAWTTWSWMMSSPSRMMSLTFVVAMTILNTWYICVESWWWCNLCIRTYFRDAWLFRWLDQAWLLFRDHRDRDHIFAEKVSLCFKERFETERQTSWLWQSSPPPYIVFAIGTYQCPINAKLINASWAVGGTLACPTYVLGIHLAYTVWLVKFRTQDFCPLHCIQTRSDIHRDSCMNEGRGNAVRGERRLSKGAAQMWRSSKRFETLNLSSVALRLRRCYLAPAWSLVHLPASESLSRNTIEVTLHFLVHSIWYQSLTYQLRMLPKRTGET